MTGRDTSRMAGLGPGWRAVAVVTPLVVVGGLLAWPLPLGDAGHDRNGPALGSEPTEPEDPEGPSAADESDEVPALPDPARPPDAAEPTEPAPPPEVGDSPGEPEFESSVRSLPEDVRDEMIGVSWHEGCPVGLDDLALVEVAHHDFNGKVAAGELVVAERVAEDVVAVFADLFDAGFPIERMRRIDHYDGDDDASMADNNSTAFNCRPVTGGQRWSEHAYGTAIDLNPVQNPYVRGATVLPEAGSDYLDRSDERPGMIVRPGPAVEAFESIGWGWGGDWQSLSDYMHFSGTGR